MFKSEDKEYTIENHIERAVSNVSKYECYINLTEDVKTALKDLETEGYEFDALMAFAVAVKVAWDDEQDRKSWPDAIVDEVFNDDHSVVGG